MKSRWLVFVLMTLASVSPAFADRRSILGLGAAYYDKEGALPVGVYRFTGWQPGYPGIDAGIETILFLNQLDLDVCYPMRFSRVTLTPRIGPTVVAGFFGGRAGLGFGGQVLIEVGEQRNRARRDAPHVLHRRHRLRVAHHQFHGGHGDTRAP